jgi:hypothetical protein
MFPEASAKDKNILAVTLDSLFFQTAVVTCLQPFFHLITTIKFYYILQLFQLYVQAGVVIFTL